jgi:exonuclease III
MQLTLFCHNVLAGPELLSSFNANEMSDDMEKRESVLIDANSSPAARKRSYAPDRPISPPPLRRKTNATSSPSQDLPIKNRFEILSWNVNGITPLLKETTPKITSFFGPKSEAKEEEVYSLRNVLKRHKFPQVVCLQEVKINSKDEATKRSVERAANPVRKDDDGPRYKAWFSLPRDKFNARGFGGKVYGVCTLVRSDLLENSETKVETKEVKWDLEGRVLVTLFEQWKLVIVNGYWVNGTLNPYRDPQSGEVVGVRHDRKRAFHSLMLEEVKQSEGEGWNVCLVGDMNIARSSIDGYPGIRLGIEHVRNRQDFNEKFFEGEEGMKGVDTWRWSKGEKRGYTYHGEKEEEWGRSCDRVDLGIVSRKMVEWKEGGLKANELGRLRGGVQLLEAEIWETVEERGHSDHVPISVVLDVGVNDREERS